MSNKLDYRRLSRVVRQLEALRSTYDIDIYDLSEIRDLSYREGYQELYQVVTENPTRYIQDILHNVD